MFRITLRDFRVSGVGLGAKDTVLYIISVGGSFTMLN